MANFSDEAVEILKARYLKKDREGNVIETPDEMLERVAEHISKAEKPEDQKKWKKRFLDIMNTLEFLPNSPTLMNAGKDIGQLSACFTLPVEDNLAAIFEVVKESALIHKTGGGTGFNFSKLRPAGSIVGSTKGVASGPVSFLQAFDAATETVKQGGVRRGANMGILNCTHPNIFEFVDCKKNTSRFQNFNLSVGINGDFLDRSKSGKNHILINPCNKNDKIVVDSKKLMNRICSNIWETGEPGVIFLDIINKYNVIPWMGKIDTTNPCVSGDTLVMIAGDSPKKIKDLVGKKFPVFCVNKRGKLVVRNAYNVRKTRNNQKLYKVLLDDGSFIDATEDHTFILSNNKKVLLRDLKAGDSLMRFDRETYNWHGVNYWKVSNGNIGKLEHRHLDEYYFGRKCNEDEIIHHKDFSGLNNLKENLQIMTKKEHRDIHDISGDKNPIFKLKKNGKFEEYKKRNSFYNTSGENNPRYGVKLSDETKHKIGIKTIERFTNEEFRLKHSEAVKKSMVVAKDKLIGDRIEREEVKCEFCNGTITRKINSERVFCDVLCRNRGLNKRRSARVNHKVISIEFSRVEDVYDLTVDEFLNYAVVTSQDEAGQHGLVIWDCGEQPLLAWESCNLGSIDVSKFYKDEDIDWNRLIKVVEIAVRFLDDVIDVNKYPRVKIERKTKTTRKIGLGIMGWADLLLEMKIKYDTDDALALAEKLMSTITNHAHRVSEQIGKEKGYFPAGNGKLNRRNATLTTIAPTGTLSLLANCSSGIEPVFAKNFTKKVLGDVKIDISKKYKDHVDSYFVTALEIKPEWHVRMQAAFQKYVDNAVSKTINLPFETTIDDIRDAIYLAHSLGCKGLTLYRQGTREAPIEISTEGLSECDNGKCSI
jgi:ribonucleoside-diphosphate reductase alpha chain